MRARIRVGLPQAAQLNTPVAPGLFRRLASGFYDALIVFAIWLLVTFIAVIPLTHGHTFESLYTQHPGIKALYQIVLLALGYVFFGFFWTRGGQTLGMRTWQLRVVRADGAALGWYAALLRYIALLIPWLLLLLSAELFMVPRQTQNAPVAQFVGAIVLLAALAGFLWPAFDPQHLGWQDRLSRTRLQHAPRARK